VQRFVFETPFTRAVGGQARGEVAHQWKLKTLLTTEHAFPHLKVRLRVKETETIELTPIKVAIEDLEQKLGRLEAACTTLDIVLLQVPGSASLSPLGFDHLVRPVLRWSLAAWWPPPSTPAPWR